MFFRDTPETALSRDEAGSYAGALDMLRLAPSAGNTQPWRVVKSGDEFRFFIKPTSPRYEARRLHDVDVGIALCHFELAAREAGLLGRWHAADTAPAVSGMRYVITWQCESWLPAERLTCLTRPDFRVYSAVSFGESAPDSGELITT